jgi:DnaK suppressor protein
MAATKPSVKATQAKKTALKKPVAKKPEPAKKAGPAKKSSAVRAKPTAARNAIKPVPKVSVTHTAKPAKARAPAESTAKPATPSAAKTPAATTATKALAPAVVPKATPKVAPNGVAPQVVSAAPPKAAPAAKAVASRPAAEISEPTSTGSDDDGEDINTNLLAGPRNVKPYIARRGEQYMGKEQLQHFRNILNTWKLDLMHEVDRTVLHMKDEAANFPDPNDRATQESEFSLELRTRDRERKLIRKIEEALKRIDDGSYGYCNETGEEIGVKRLEARPVATLCVEAQERRERREKQYGDRDDRYR